MTDKDNFEKRLLSELRQVSADNPNPQPEPAPARGRTYGRFAAAGAGLAAVVAGIAIYTGTGDNTPSAYAVDPQPDGKVSVEILNLEEATGLEDSLKAVGVPARVTMAPAEAVCIVKPESAQGPVELSEKSVPSSTTAPSTKAVPAGLAKQAGRTGVAVAKPVELDVVEAKGASFSIDPNEIGEGETVVISPSTGEVTKLIRADDASAPSIEVKIAESADEDC